MAPPAGTGILCLIRRYLRDRRGISAVEFALVAPIMITLLLGGAEVTQAITIKRKTIIATRALADLVAQSAVIGNGDLTNIFDATRAVLEPFPEGDFKFVVSSVAIDGAGNAEILWSEASNGAAPHTEVTLPPGLNEFPNTSLIWAEGEYAYTPIFGFIFTGIVPLKDHIYLRPRLNPYVCRETSTKKICKPEDV